MNARGLVRAVAVRVHDDQLRYFGDGLRYVLLDAIALIVSQKRMRRANRPLPHRDQGADESGVAMFRILQNHGDLSMFA